MSAADSNSCGLKPDGAVECWGYGYCGNTVYQPGPFTQFSAGSCHTCGLKEDGSVDCWGADDGRADDRSGPFGPYVPNQPPIVANVEAAANPVMIEALLSLTAVVDDTVTGGFNITSAEYGLDGGGWMQMEAQDGTYDESREVVAATFKAPSEAGIYDLCVRGLDAGGYASAGHDCVTLVVYDPDGGFATGGGWITSPEGAVRGGGTISGAAGDSSPDPGAA